MYLCIPAINRVRYGCRFRNYELSSWETRGGHILVLFVCGIAEQKLSTGLEKITLQPSYDAGQTKCGKLTPFSKGSHNTATNTRAYETICQSSGQVPK